MYMNINIQICKSLKRFIWLGLLYLLQIILNFRLLDHPLATRTATTPSTSGECQSVNLCNRSRRQKLACHAELDLLMIFFFFYHFQIVLRIRANKQVIGKLECILTVITILLSCQ